MRRQVRKWLGITAAVPRRVVLGAAVTGCLAAMVAFATPAAADPGWSASPTSALPGGTVRVASSPSALCQSRALPTDPTTDPTTDATTAPTVSSTDPATPTATATDGTRVELRLDATGGPGMLGSVPVTAGGAWSGTFTVPETTVVAPGTYDLVARCVIDAATAFDFDAISFTIVEGPPPTTLEIPTELVPPVTAINPVHVQGAQLGRGTTASNSSGTAATPAATLPNTGDGTLGVALAGLAALLLGGVTLWFGARHGRQHARPHPSD